MSIRHCWKTPNLKYPFETNFNGKLSLYKRINLVTSTSPCRCPASLVCERGRFSSIDKASKASVGSPALSLSQGRLSGSPYFEIF